MQFLTADRKFSNAHTEPLGYNDIAKKQFARCHEVSFQSENTVTGVYMRTWS